LTRASKSELQFLSFPTDDTFHQWRGLPREIEEAEEASPADAALPPGRTSAVRGAAPRIKLIAGVGLALILQHIGAPAPGPDLLLV